MAHATAHGARLGAGAVAALAGIALALQYVLLLDAQAGVLGAGWTTLRFLSYFTILSNLLVAVVAGHAAVAGARGAGGPRAAAALYIAVTAIVYATVLRGQWAPEGLQWVADALLHYAVPGGYLAWWTLGTRHGDLGWEALPRWLLAPLAYVAAIILRQRTLEPWSPYPFLDLSALPPTTVLANVAVVTALFLGIGALLVRLDRALCHR